MNRYTPEIVQEALDKQVAEYYKQLATSSKIYRFQQVMFKLGLTTTDTKYTFIRGLPRESNLR